MTKIQIIKKQDGYAYKYYMMDKNNRPFYVTKSGFETPEKALEVAKKSYLHRIHSIEKSQPIHTANKTKPTTKKKSIKKIELKPIKLDIKNRIKNLKVTDGGYKIVEALVFGAVTIVIVCGGIKTYNDLKGKFPEKKDLNIETEDESISKELITVKDCDFSNLHIILRTATKETNGVGAVTSDMLTKLGINNEVISKDSDLSYDVYRALNNNSDSNIVVINIECGLENKNNNKTIVMGDCSNRRQYPSDILAACINTALNDYNLDSTVKSGQKADIWRKQTDIEKELTNSGLINSISQLTIDLPIAVSEDELTRNDAAASIVEGLMRWTAIAKDERYIDIYYTTQYSDNIVTLMSDHGLTIKYLEENSDIDMSKGSRVGNTVLLGPLPKIVTNTIVYNPCTTTDPTEIEPVTIEYIVQYGDTVTKIANMYGMTIDDVVVPSGNINSIRPGDVLYINTYNMYETHSKTGSLEKDSEKQNIK